MSNPQNKPNLLINETSPYLLQHAYNPVHWYPWGDEAFEIARQEDKPVFLSIGYSTCHWCHVMAQESFEDEAIAKLLNNYFIAIKVDREERPDIDSIYMSVCQGFTGAGGWPLSIFMTPEQVPFFAGTYFPKKSDTTGMGLDTLLPRLHTLWTKYPVRITEACREIQTYLKNLEVTPNPMTPQTDFFKQAVAIFSEGFDLEYGGFFQAPKFPAPHNLLFLLRYGSLKQDSHCLFMAEKTLECMYRGGLFDHIGGGFSRYSTDEKWLIPHFEKMLYDNALLAYVYLEAYQLTKRELYKDAAVRTIDYVFKELTDTTGGFFCGQDADVEGKEGKFYAFTDKEIREVLGSNAGRTFNKWYGITKEGNFEGENILNLLNNPLFEEFPDWLSSSQNALYYYRLLRNELHFDNKMLTSWNALMVMTLAKAYRILGTPYHLEAAKKALTFINDYLIDENDNLFASYCDGECKIPGFIDDYSFLCYSLLEMYQADFNPDYLQQAITLAEKMLDLFFDSEAGGFYLYSKNSEQLIARPKEAYDGAMPSGNSMAFLSLIRLFHLTGDAKWKPYIDKQAAFLSSFISKYPAGYSQALCGMIELLYPYRQILVTSDSKTTALDLSEILNQTFFINTCIQVKCPETVESLQNLAPFTSYYPISKNENQFYICEGHSCKQPVSSLTEAMNLLQPFLP